MPPEANTGLQPIVDDKTINLAAVNYMECLALPEQSQVLIVTDVKHISADENLLLRRSMASAIRENIVEAGYVADDQFLDPQMSRKAMYENTRLALLGLDDMGNAYYHGQDRTTTVVYLGNAWDNRAGIYDAVSEFAKSKPQGSVRLAGSLGFTSGDCRVMSHLGKEQREKIVKAGEYFKSFMKTHPQGRFNIQTADAQGKLYTASFDYDTAKAPFITEYGRFAPDEVTIHNGYDYKNIPGGETFGVPNPWRHSTGQFMAEGVVFTAEEGLIKGAEQVDVSTGAELSNPSQRLLLQHVRNGRPMPVAELGLGLYALAGVSTYPDSSLLSAEKGGPHIGMGHTYETTEAEAINTTAGDFQHTDFVMREPVIVYQDLDTKATTEFYPPHK